MRMVACLTRVAACDTVVVGRVELDTERWERKERRARQRWVIYVVEKQDGKALSSIYARDRKDGDGERWAFGGLELRSASANHGEGGSYGVESVAVVGRESAKEAPLVADTHRNKPRQMKGNF